MICWHKLDPEDIFTLNRGVDCSQPYSNSSSACERDCPAAGSLALSSGGAGQPRLTGGADHLPGGCHHQLWGGYVHAHAALDPRVHDGGSVVLKYLRTFKFKRKCYN